MALRQLIAQYKGSGTKASFSTWLQTTLAAYVKNNPGSSPTTPADPQASPIKWILGAIEIGLGELPPVVVAKIGWESAWEWLFETGATLPGDIQTVLENSQKQQEQQPPDLGPVSEGDDGGDDGDDGDDGGGGGGCFAAGTLVATPQGPRAIETIGLDERVVSRGEDAETVGVDSVTRVWRHAERPTLVLHLANGEPITTTAPHRFFAGERGFVAAKDLRAGDRVMTRANETIAIARIESAMPALTVYNLSVANAHTYFVGESQVWVHNVKVDNDGNPDDGDGGDDGGAKPAVTKAKPAAKQKPKSKPAAKKKPKPAAKKKPKPAAKQKPKPAAKQKAKPAAKQKKRK